MRIYKNKVKGTLRLSVVFAYALAISAVGLFPLVNSQEASAAQLTSRRSTITTLRLALQGLIITLSLRYLQVVILMFRA
jgi:hypothetical protein